MSDQNTNLPEDNIDRSELFRQNVLSDVSVGRDFTLNGNITQKITVINHSEHSQSIGIPQNIPPTTVNNFVGRNQEIEDIHQKLQQENLVTITGMGGLGKTELAIQYAKQYQKYYFGGICYLQARGKNIGEQIINFAQNNLSLGIPEDIKKKDINNQVSWVWQHWQEGKVLVIFDDVNNYTPIKSFLPYSSRFYILITARLQLLKSSQRLELKVLQEDAALSLLESFIDNQERIKKQYRIAQKLCNWLGYLPLGLELVGRYLGRKQDLYLATMLHQLQDKNKSLEHKALKKSKFNEDMTAQLGVAAAFELSWEELSEDAQILGCFLSIFDLSSISWDLVECCFYDQNIEDLEEIRDDELVALHLLQWEKIKVYKLHELIKEFFQLKLLNYSPNEIHDLIIRKLGNLAVTYPACLSELLDKINLSFIKQSQSSLPSALGWGQQIYTANQCWCKGLGQLAKSVIPLKKDGSLPTLGIALVKDNHSIANNLEKTNQIIFDEFLRDNQNSFYLVTGWCFRDDIKENVIELPPGVINDSENNDISKMLNVDTLFPLGWNYFKLSLIKPNIATALQYTFTEIVQKLSKLLQQRSLPISSGHLSLEAAWYGAIYLTKKHLINSYKDCYLYCEPISLDEIENYLANINKSRYSLMIQHCLNQLIIEVENCRNNGKNYLSLPVSVCNFRTSSVLSSEIIFDYTKDIFQRAIESYEQLVNTLFPKFISQLPLASIFPAKMLGFVIPPKHFSDSISVSWHWESLSKNQTSYADLRLLQDKSSLIRDQYPPIQSFSDNRNYWFPEGLEQKPFNKSWLAINPVTEMVYKWLWKDLKKIGWVKDERLPNAGFPYWR